MLAVSDLGGQVVGGLLCDPLAPVDRSLDVPVAAGSTGRGRLTPGSATGSAKFVRGYLT
jgi:hypothetical protein